MLVINLSWPGGVYEKEQKTEMKEMYFLNNVEKRLGRKGKQLQVVQKRRLDDSSWKGAYEWMERQIRGHLILLGLTKTSDTIM